MTEVELRKFLPNASEDEIKYIIEKIESCVMDFSPENEIADELDYLHEGWEGPY